MVQDYSIQTITENSSSRVLHGFKPNRITYLNPFSYLLLLYYRKNISVRKIKNNSLVFNQPSQYSWM